MMSVDGTMRLAGYIVGDVLAEGLDHPSESVGSTLCVVNYLPSVHAAVDDQINIIQVYRYILIRYIYI